MSALTTYAEKMLLDWLLTGGAVPRPTTWFVALHTGDPTESGAENEVLVTDDADYVRQAVAFLPAEPGSVGSQSLSDTNIAHTPAVDAAAYTVTHISIWDAATGGNALKKGELQVHRTIDSDNPFALNAGDIVAALD